jgi:hypothetical protein
MQESMSGLKFLRWLNPGWRKQRKQERKKENLEKYRLKTLTIVVDFRSRVEEMAQRPRSDNDKLDNVLLESVRKRLSEIEDSVKLATNKTELRNLENSADDQETFRAYFCPRSEIRIEGNLLITLLEWWGIPTTEIDNLRGLLMKEIENTDNNPEDARRALRALYKEKDDWADYRDDYEEEMQKFGKWLSLFAIIFAVSAIFLFHFGCLFPIMLPCGILVAGIAGSCVSVAIKLPALSEIRSEKIDSYKRWIWGRVGAGAIGSLIGCGFFGWGLISVGVSGQTFADILNSCVACSQSTVSSNLALRILVLLAVPMVFGFSERALTSFEISFFHSSKKN